MYIASRCQHARISHLMSATHYEDRPMEYTAIFHGCKTGNFSMKKCYIFIIFAQNIYRVYVLEQK